MLRRAGLVVVPVLAPAIRAGGRFDLSRPGAGNLSVKLETMNRRTLRGDVS